MQLIGLSGYARSGKDEAAKVLVEEFGFERIAFADKLRDFLYALDPVVPMGWGDKNTKEIEFLLDHPKDVPFRVQDVINKFGWDGYKETGFGTEIRGLLQRLGTEAGRQTISDTIWVDAALSGLRDGGRYVITDARFPNEADAVTSRGGQLWRIMRAGVGPANTHASETSLDEHSFDAYIHNDGSLQDFRKSVARKYLEGVSK